jgi:DNA repair protein RecO (recombination protein O)
MPLHESESIILKTYPLKESDRIVVFFSRDHGKIRGVANGVGKLKSRFGASLEPMALSRVTFFQKETRELVRIQSTELIDSPLKVLVDYDRAMVAAHFADLVDRFMPDHDVQDAVFRLFALTRRGIAGSLPLELVRCYFEVWMLRLAGVLPDVFFCPGCNRRLGPDEDRFLMPGLTRIACERCDRGRDPGRIPMPRTSIDTFAWIMTTRLDEADPEAIVPSNLEHVLQLNKLWIERFFDQ